MILVRSTPAETERGPVYEFKLLHAVEVENPLELFRIEMVVIS